jgi:2-oxoglutarate ferredoxin oxidoreductase subunit beta
MNLDEPKATCRLVFGRSPALRDAPHHFCPGCGHGIIARIAAEVVEEMGLREDTIAVAPVGCAVYVYKFWNFDCSEAPHGRTPCVASGIKRVYPDKLVFTYQGDGDLAAIGTGEIIHTANRGECISVIFVNNTCYGMTGGQMAPTTLVGQKSSTTPRGRDFATSGAPVQVCELLAHLPGARYVERCSIGTPERIMAAKRSIRRAFEVQRSGQGFSLVEVLSPCPVNWGVTPVEAMEILEKELPDYFPLGKIKDTTRFDEPSALAKPVAEDSKLRPKKDA